MREIKFRGLSVNGDWYYGNLSRLNKKLGICEKGSYISNSAGSPFAYQVRPETVGQFIGIINSNGVELYEGDKIRRYILKYWEQRSFPEYVDCCGYNLVEITDEIIFKEGAFSIKSDIELSLVNWNIREALPEYKIVDGVIEVDGCGVDCEEDDLQKLLLFEVIGNIHE